MNSEIFTSSFLAVHQIAEKWVRNKNGTVCIAGRRIHHYEAGLASVLIGTLIKISGSEKYSLLGDILLGSGLSAVLHDGKDLIDDYRHRRGIFQYF